MRWHQRSQAQSGTRGRSCTADDLAATTASCSIIKNKRQKVIFMIRHSRLVVKDTRPDGRDARALAPPPPAFDAPHCGLLIRVVLSAQNQHLTVRVCQPAMAVARFNLTGLSLTRSSSLLVLGSERASPERVLNRAQRGAHSRTPGRRPWSSPPPPLLPAAARSVRRAAP